MISIREITGVFADQVFDCAALTHAQDISATFRKFPLSRPLFTNRTISTYFLYDKF